METTLNVQDAPAALPELKPTLGMAVRVAWALFWRTLLWMIPVVAGVSLLALGLSYLAMQIGGLGGLMVALIVVWVLISLITGGVAFIVAGYVMQRVFSKRFKRFTVHLLDAETGLPTTRRWHVRLRLWWSMTWRSVVIGNLLLLPFSFPLNQYAVQQRHYEAYANCKTIIADYHAAMADPALAEVAAAKVEEYHRNGCDDWFAEGVVAPEPAPVGPSVGLALAILIGSLLIHIKIVQIMLAKRYRKFRILVTPNVAAA